VTEHILKGAQPVDLPIEPAIKVTLNMNLKTAKALSLTIADEVIE
jgi:ABC-type uncharacterized transport system substrate-binding protein